MKTTMRVVLALAVIVIVFMFLGASATYTPGVYTMQVTIGASVTQFTTTDTPVKQVMVQNNAAHDIRVGDSNTSTTRGADLLSSSHGSINFGASGNSSGLNLNQLWVAGTQNDVVDVIYVQ